MTEPADDRTELFLRFSRQNMIASLVIVLVLGGSALSLMLAPTRAVWRSAAQASLITVPIVIAVAVAMSLRRRRWASDAREVRLIMQDELRRTNMLRASRAALIVVLIAQWPLAMMLGFLTHLPPRGAMAMAASTITLGLVTLITLFLFFDRE